MLLFPHLQIRYGDKEVFLTAESSSSYSKLLLFFFAPILIIIFCTGAATGKFDSSKANRRSYGTITLQPFVSPSGGHILSSQAEDARRADGQAVGRAGARHQE